MSTTIEEFFKTTFGIDVNHEIEEIMNRESLLRTINLLTALSQGKTLQLQDLGTSAWMDCTGLAPDDRRLFTSSDAFRVKPEQWYRQWKLEEIPIGAVARRTHKSLNQTPQVIIGADYLSVSTRDERMACAIMHFESKEYTTATYLLKGWEWKWAHEDAHCWRPCGAVEGA